MRMVPCSFAVTMEFGTPLPGAMSPPDELARLYLDPFLYTSRGHKVVGRMSAFERHARCRQVTGLRLVCDATAQEWKDRGTA